MLGSGAGMAGPCRGVLSTAAGRARHRRSVALAASDAQPGSPGAGEQTGEEFEIVISSETPTREAVFIH